MPGLGESSADSMRIPRKNRCNPCARSPVSTPKGDPRARLTLAEAQLSLAALQAMAGQGAVGGGQALVSICAVHGLDDAVRVLDTWLDARE
jgi:hypothetical protein